MRASTSVAVSTVAAYTALVSNVGLDPGRVRQTATTIPIAMGYVNGAVMVIAAIAGLLVFRNYRKKQAQAKLGQVNHDIRLSVETLPGYKAGNGSGTSLANLRTFYIDLTICHIGLII